MEEMSHHGLYVFCFVCRLNKYGGLRPKGHCHRFFLANQRVRLPPISTRRTPIDQSYCDSLLLSFILPAKVSSKMSRQAAPPAAVFNSFIKAIPAHSFEAWRASSTGVADGDRVLHVYEETERLLNELLTTTRLQSKEGFLSWVGDVKRLKVSNLPSK